jgi:hypothetical protein
MNTDLYTLLLFLGCIGAFLAIVVGRLQFSQDDELDREVVARIKAVKSLEDDYEAQSDVAKSLGANLERNDFLPTIGRRLTQDADGEQTAGLLFRRALAIYEAIEHVDSPAIADRTYDRIVEEFGLGGPSELHRADLKTMLRIARVSIHSRSNLRHVDEYRKELRGLADASLLNLSDAGRMRMREILNLLQARDMQSLVDEYRDLIPVIEEILLDERVISKPFS